MTNISQSPNIGKIWEGWEMVKLLIILSFPHTQKPAQATLYYKYTVLVQFHPEQCQWMPKHKIKAVHTYMILRMTLSWWYEGLRSSLWINKLYKWPWRGWGVQRGIIWGLMSWDSHRPLMGKEWLIWHASLLARRSLQLVGYWSHDNIRLHLPSHLCLRKKMTN